jgi:hypothetical protein
MSPPVEWTRGRSLLLITSRQTEHLFGRAFDDNKTMAAAFDEDRNPAALEIERHLALGGEADFTRSEGCFIERALELGLERGIEQRHPHHFGAVLPVNVSFPD